MGQLEQPQPERTRLKEAVEFLTELAEAGVPWAQVSLMSAQRKLDIFDIRSRLMVVVPDTSHERS